MEILNNINTQTAVQSGASGAQGAVKTPQGGLFKNQPTPQSVSEQSVQNALDNVGKLVARVLDELKSSASITKTEQILEQAKDTRIAPNFSNDLQSLAKALESEGDTEQNASLKELALKLKEFLKPIAELKNAPLNEQIKNSGVLLEANLKDALSGEKLPSSIQKLLSDIKNLGNQNLLNEILTLANDENLDNQNSFSKLSTVLENTKNQAQNTLNNSNIKALLSDVNKLDNVSKFLDKMSAKDPNADNIKMQVGKMLDFVSNLKDKIGGLANEKLNQNFGFSSNHKELRTTLEALQKDLKFLNDIGDEAGLVKEFKALSGSSNEASLQDKLQSAARRLAQTLNFADASASAAKANLDESKALLKQLKLASNDITNITQKNSAEVAKALSGDVKSTLLSISEKSQNPQISQMANKMLSQIEIHQVVSSLQGGIQTYMPYVWDGVEGGNVAFKRGKKDKYYAQIDLNFKKYGQVNVMVGLIDKRYIDISVATQTSEFKNLISSGAGELKQAISQLGLIVSNFNLKA
ncbi:MAG: hypothetical protein ACFNUJ_06535, partial [Campylobacter curvus]